MKQVKYFCNLCGEHKEGEDLVSIYWDSTLMKTDKDGEKIFGGYRIITELDKSDKHVCKNCFSLIYEFVEKNK